RDRGTVGQRGAPPGHERDRHELEDAVLGSGHRDLAGEPRASGDEEALLAGCGVGAHGVHPRAGTPADPGPTSPGSADRKSTRLNSSHVSISSAVFCLKKKTRSP